MHLKVLNTSIQDCKKCKLHLLEYNIFNESLGYGKLLGSGGTDIIIVAQNPSTHRVSYQTQAMGVDYELKWSGDFFRKNLIDLGINTLRIYWTNVVKCSTEGNISPSDEIINVCGEWLLKEIELVKPRKIVAMGQVSYNYLMSQNLKIPVTKIWHYAYVNRNNNLLDEYNKTLIKELK